MKKTITESMLKDIIAESIMSMINEIGDTEAGYNAIRNAETKARQQGRHNQKDAFQNYADNIDAKRFGVTDNQKGIIKATNKVIEYYCDGLKRYIRIYADGKVEWFGAGRKDFMGYIVTYPILEQIKVSSERKSDARKIALWCQRFLQINDEGIKKRTEDWHTWAAL